MSITGTSPPYRSFAQFRKVVHLIYAALCFGLATAIGLIWFAIDGMPGLEPEQAAKIDESSLLIAGGVMSVVCVGIAAFLPALATARVPPEQLGLKMRSVLFSRILFAAAFECGGLLWAVLALVVRDPRYLGGAAAALGILVAMFPTTARLEESLESTEDGIDRRLAGGAT